MLEFPIIDISPLFSGHSGFSERQNCIDQIRQACLTTGFFAAKGTSISRALIEQVYQQSAAFHQLDPETKQPYRSSTQAISRGWVPLHEEPAYQPGTIAHVEAFDMGLHLLPGDPDYASSPLLGSNVYPDLIGFRETVDAYYTQANQLGHVLLEAFAEMLKLERYRFSHMSTRRAGSTLRLLHYPGSQQPLNGANVGISAHSDFEMLTIMHQNAPGLQLMTRDGEWVDAPVLPDAVNIILDDGLEFLTNGVLKATQHRVPLTSWERYSIILFYAADVEQVLQPLPEFVSLENPARYAPITQVGHILQQVQNGLVNLAEVSE
jgi:isopenicillin N synthase-like dioxygenase